MDQLAEGVRRRHGQRTAGALGSIREHDDAGFAGLRLRAGVAERVLHLLVATSLLALDAHLRRYKQDPVESVRSFREEMRLVRLPLLLRRLLMWLALDVLPRRRARHFGTFGVTTMSPFGAKTVDAPCIWGALLHYGAVTEAGEAAVGLTFDHRLMDGAVVGYTLQEMEQVLRYQIVAELRAMRGVKVWCSLKITTKHCQ